MRCRFHRWSLSRALSDGRAPSPRAQRHLAACPACRAWHERMAALEAQLRQAAPPAESLPTGLAERILAATDAVPAVRRRRRVRRLLPAIAALAAAACVLFAVIVLPGDRARRNGKGGGSVARGPVTRPKASPRLAGLGPAAVTAGLWTRLDHAMNAAAADELERLKADARSLRDAFVDRVSVGLFRQQAGAGSPGAPTTRGGTRLSPTTSAVPSPPARG
jgi:hypothetical protein